MITPKMCGLVRQTSMYHCFDGRLLWTSQYHIYVVSQLEDYQPPWLLQMELQNRDIFLGINCLNLLLLFHWFLLAVKFILVGSYILLEHLVLQRFLTTKTLPLGDATAFRALPCSANIGPVMCNKASRSITGLEVMHQSEEHTSHLGTLHKDMFLYQLLLQREQALLDSHCNTFESLDRSLIQEVSKHWFGLVQILHQKQATPGKPSSQE